MKTKFKTLFHSCLFLALATSLSISEVKAAAAYASGTFVVGVEDVDSSSSDYDNNDMVLSVRYLAQYNNSCTKPSGNCLVNLILLTTPLAAGATHSLGVRLFPYVGSPTSYNYDYTIHGSSGPTVITSHTDEAPMYNGISDMFTCGASSYVNTIGSPSCQGKARAFSFYFEDNTLEIDTTNMHQAISDLIHVENYTLCQGMGLDSTANSGSGALVYSIFGAIDGGIPPEYTSYYDAYGLTNDSTFGSSGCDVAGWDSTCPGKIGSYMGSLGSLPAGVIELDGTGVFKHPSWEIAKWDSTNDVFQVASNWVDNPMSGNSATSGAGTAEIGRATSELQSHSDLVCRLLLEKKKTK